MTNTATAPSSVQGSSPVRGRPGVLAMMANPKGLWRFLRDRNAPKAAKFAALLAVLYIVVPTDFIPDLAPVLGWLDDLGMSAVALTFIASQAAKYHGTALRPEEAPVRPTEVA